jgi:integrase
MKALPIQFDESIPAWEKAIYAFLAEAEYRRLQEACQNHPRNAALIELFLQTGLRLSEVASLTLDDLELPTSDESRSIGAVSVNGKGRKRR